MTLLEFLILLLVAALAGAIGQAIAGFSSGGFLVSAAVGFIGAVFGVWLARALGLPTFFTFTIGGTTFPLLWSIVGSALFVAIIGFFARGRL